MATDPRPLDHRSFEDLYRATVGVVHSLARRILGVRFADAATQEVYLRAWRKRQSYRGEGSASAWLRRLAHNELVNQASSRMREVTEAPIDNEDTTRPEPRGDLLLDLEVALERLPDGARQVFVLHDVEGRPHAEIAAQLGVSVGTSKSQLHRARALLRATLLPWSETRHE